MCELCVKHGEAKKWYLEAKSCSDDLFNDIHRRDFIEEFLSKPERLGGNAERLARLEKELEKIFQFVNGIVRIPCVCRSACA